MLRTSLLRAILPPSVVLGAAVVLHLWVGPLGLVRGSTDAWLLAQVQLVALGGSYGSAVASSMIPNTVWNPLFPALISGLSRVLPLDPAFLGGGVAALARPGSTWRSWLGAGLLAGRANPTWFHSEAWPARADEVADLVDAVQATCPTLPIVVMSGAIENVDALSIYDNAPACLLAVETRGRTLVDPALSSLMGTWTTDHLEARLWALPGRPAPRIEGLRAMMDREARRSADVIARVRMGWRQE